MGIDCKSSQKASKANTEIVSGHGEQNLVPKIHPLIVVEPFDFLGMEVVTNVCKTTGDTIKDGCQHLLFMVPWTRIQINMPVSKFDHLLGKILSTIFPDGYKNN